MADITVPGPLLTAHLFPTLDAHLIDLLRTLTVGDRVATVIIPQDIAWRIFTKGIDRESASKQVRVTGDVAVGGHVLEMLAIVG